MNKKLLEIYWGEKDAPAKEKEVLVERPTFVEVVDNHVYFYADIQRSEILQLNKRLRQLNNDLLYSARIQERSPASIFMHINSYGGGIFYGLAGMDAVLRCQVPVVTIIDGCCASAATFLSVVGGKRYIHENGFMLIHQLSALTWGKFRELQDDNVNFNRLMKTIKEIYTRYTKIPEKKIAEILDHDLWFDAETCLEYGLVDEVLKGEKA